MSTNAHADEAAQIINDIEDNAADGDSLTVDQWLMVASVRASLASIEAGREQVAATREQSALLARNAENAERMIEILTAQTSAPTTAAGDDGEGVGA